MGKRQVHVIRVRRWVTVVLLVVTSAAMAGLVYVLSGRAYAGDSPLRELLTRLLRGGRSLSPDAFLAFLMPMIANALLFVPWGFLAFLSLDAPVRPRVRTYALTVVAGLLFAAAIATWQELLPTRVTTFGDAVANGAGALAGAALGHLRKEMRVRFDF